MFTLRRRVALVCILLLAATMTVAIAGARRTLPTMQRSVNVPTSTAIGTPNARVTPFASPVTGTPAVLPPIPPPPSGQKGAIRHIRSANGTTLTLTQGTGCGGSLAFSLVQGCSVSVTVTKGPNVTGTEVGYVLAPGTATPVAYGFGSAYTLGNAGYYVFGAFNTTTNAWDDLLYLAVGTVANVVATDPSGNSINTITADGSARINFTVTGLTTGDNYVVGAESTSVTGQCAWLTNQNGTTPVATPTGSLCDPSNTTATIAATSGQIQATWIPAATVGGTMSVIVWDVSVPGAPVRVAETQITVVATQFKPTTTAAAGTMPSWQFAEGTAFGAVVNPAIFAFYSVQDANNGGASVPTFVARVPYPSSELNDQYTMALTDPTGEVITTTTGAANSGNTYVNPQFSFSLVNYVGNKIGQSTPFSEFGYKNANMTLSLLDTTRSLLVAATPVKIVGFSAQAMWEPQGGGALTDTVVTNGATAVNGQFILTNNGDAVFGPDESDSLNEFVLTVATGSPAISDINVAGSHTATFTDASGGTWLLTITAQNPGFVLTFQAQGGTSLPPNAVLTSPIITVDNKNNGCSSACPITTQIKPVHGTGNLSLDPRSNTTFNLVNQMAISNTARATRQSYGELYQVGYVPAAGGTVTTGADAHRYSNRLRTIHAVYAQPDLGMSATGFYDVWAFNLTANNNGDGHDFQIAFPNGFDASKVLQSSQLTGLTGGTAFTAQRCTQAPSSNYVCFSGGTYGSGTQTVYFALPPPSQAFSYQDAVAQLNTTSGFQSSGGVNVLPATAPTASTTIYDDQFLTSVDPLSIASYSLDGTKIAALVSPSTVGQNKTNFPVTLQVTNSNTTVGNFPDYIDQIVVDVADQGGQTLTANGTSTPAGWTLQSTTTSGVPAGARRYWFSVCPTEVTPNDTYGPTASVGNGGSVSVPDCSSTAGWQQASLAPASSVQIPLALRTATSSITMNVYAHGANGGGWSKPIPFTIAVSNATAAAGFSAAGTYGNPSTVGNGTEPTIGLASNGTYGDSFLYEVTNTGNTTVSSFAVTIPGKDVSGVNAYDGTYAWQFTSAPVIVPAQGDTSTYGCVLTQPAGASGSYVSANSAGNDGHIFVAGCSLPPGKSVVVSFTALYPQTINESYRFTSAFNWTAYNAGTNTTDGAATGEEWFSDQLVNVTTATSLIVYIPQPGTTTYAALSPADTASPVVSLASCSGCTFLNSPNTIDMGTVPAGTSKFVQDGVLVRVIDANAPNGWKLYASTTYNLAYSGGGDELQLAYDSTRSTQGKGLEATSGTGYLNVPTSTPGIGIADNGSASAVQTPYDMLMNVQVQVGSETQTTSFPMATVTYTWIAN